MTTENANNSNQQLNNSNLTQNNLIDLISRQAAIDALVSYFGFDIEDEYGSAVKEVLMKLPSAQPVAKDTNVPSKDTISRQAAIEALNGTIEITGRANAEAVKGYARLVKDRIERLPSAQPEIIRCKDCMWYGYYSCKQDGNSWMRSGNGYCDRAERRTDEQTY